MTEDASRPLSGLRMLEHGENIATAFAARLLCDLGAEVIKIEPPAGDPARRYGYLPEDSDVSSLFAYTNAGKRCVRLDTTTTGGRARLLELISEADVLIDASSAGWWRDAEIDFDALPGHGRCALAVSITPYGRSGSQAEWAANHLTVVHTGGEAFTLPGGIGWERYPDREPIKPPDHVRELDVGVTAAIAILAWVLSGQRSGVVELSIQEALLTLSRVDIERWPMDGWYETRASRSFPVLGLVACKDGYVQAMTMEQPQWERLVVAIGNPDWAHELGAKPADRVANGNELNALLGVWFLERTKEEIRETLLAHNVPVGLVRTPSEVLGSEQLAARDFFTPLEWPSGETTSVPGHPYVIRRADGSEWRPGPSETPPEVTALGDARFRDPPADNGVLPRRADGGAEPWLGGLRMLELTTMVAGPWGGALVTALGAESIKVENALRAEPYRRERLSKALDPNTIDLNYRFNEVNPGKRSVHVDLRSDRGRDIFEQLVAQSDVLLMSGRPGYLERHGLSVASLLETNPTLVVVSATAHGETGPESDRPGYAAIFAAEGGMSNLTGYDADLPTEYRIATDMSVGTSTAFATLVGLLVRKQTGQGVHVDCAATEVPAMLIGAHLLEWQIRGETSEPMGNHDPTRAPHNCYACRDGEERGWLALATDTDEQWQRLVGLIDDPQLDVEWNEHERKANEALIDARIAEWVRDQQRDALVERLQAIGVPSAPTLHAHDLFENPHLRSREMWATVEHGRMGELAMLGLPWLINGVRRPVRPSPLLGVDTEDVLTNRLHLPPEEVAEAVSCIPLHSQEAIANLHIPS